MESLVRTVATQRGWPSPVVVHTGSSTVYRAGDVAVRVTDAGRNPATLPDAEIVAASLALRAAGCSVTEPLSLEVLHVDGVSMTFWRWRDEDAGVSRDTSAWRALGGSLRQLHGVDTGLVLAPLGGVLVTRLETRLGILRETRPAWMSISELGMLHDITAGFLHELPEAAAGRATVHGDFHHGNILWTAGGPVISDLEGLSLGNGAYDLAVLTERERCYGLDAGLVDALVAGYGTDLRESAGFDVLVRAKQMISTQWCIVQSLRWPALDDEARKRFGWWRDGGGPAWDTNPGAKA